MRPWIMLAFCWLGCEDKGIGLPCDLPGSQNASSTQVVSNAVECPESVCILMSGREPTKGGRTQPLAYCTATCSNSSDCEGGQNCWDPAHENQLPFVCAKPVLLDSDPGPGCGLQCRGVCICEADARRQTNPPLFRSKDGNCDCIDPACDCEVVTPELCDPAPVCE